MQYSPKEILTQVTILLQSKQKITNNKHFSLFFELEKIIGSKNFTSGIILDPNNKKLNISAINKYRKPLLDTIICIQNASEYEKNIFELQHLRYNGQTVSFKVNNKKIYQILSKPLTVKNFTKLFNLAKNSGVFNLNFSHHLPDVTINTSTKHMTRKWPRDHMGMMPLIIDLYPDEFIAGIEKQAECYCSKTEISAFERVFKDPSSARQNQGIAHVFYQKQNGNLYRDKNWQINQRIESHGELLKYMTICCKQLLSTNSHISNNLIKTIVRFTHYLYIQGISPQSCGPWEEIAFPYGINWDNACIVNAFKNLLDLIDILPTDKNIWHKFTSFENTICKKFNLPPLIQFPKNLTQYINQSLNEICKYYRSEFRGATLRNDASSVMLATGELNLCTKDSLTSNIKKHLHILRKFEKKLVHPFGAWRYNQFKIYINNNLISSCDSYQNLNYYNLCNRNGHVHLNKHEKIIFFNEKGIDASSPEQFINRALGITEKTTAQWGLPISYAALAFGKLSHKLLLHWQKNSFLTIVEQKLLDECMNSSSEYIKRSYGNITGCKPDGSLFINANGQPINPWHKPEAYLAVSKNFNCNKFCFVPGINDHLGWDAAICYEASKLFLQNLQLFEKLTHKNL